MIKRHRGYTLVEIVVAIALLGIISGVAIPNYFNSVQQTRAQEAQANLNVIYAAERVFFINNGTFWPAAGTSQGTAANLVAINTNLNIDLAPPQFYPIVITSGAGATSFTAVATSNRPGSARTYTVTNANPVPTSNGGAF
jgi:prepilin-type N-terminal cleavage/methylation domain-containing protein